MAREGRIEGRVSQDGTAYELVQLGAVVQSLPIAQAHADERFKQAITRNGWESLP